MKYELPRPNSVTCQVKDDKHHVLWLGKYIVVETMTYQTIEYCLANRDRDSILLHIVGSDSLWARPAHL